MTDGTDGDDQPAAPVDSESSGATDFTVPHRASVRRNLAYMATSQAATWFFSTISWIVVPRLVGPSNVGSLSLADSLLMIVAVASTLGTSMYLQLEIARDPAGGLSLVKPVLHLRSAMFGLSFALVGAYALAFERTVSFVTILVIGAIATFAGLWSDVYSTAFIGLERMATPAVVSTVSRCVRAIVVTAVVVAGAGIVGVQTVIAVVAIIVVVVYRHRLSVLIGTTPAASAGSRWAEWRGIAAASVPFMLVGLASAVYQQVDVIVISRVAGHRELGWYATANTLIGSMLAPTTLVMASLLPTLGRLAKSDRTQFEDLVRRTYSLILVVAVPIGFGGMVLGSAMTVLIFGPEFDGAGPVVAVQSYVTLMTFGSTLLAYVAFALGRERFVVLLIASAAILTIPLDLVLVPWADTRFGNGAIGGALTYAITETLQFVVAVVMIAPFAITGSVVSKSLRAVGAGAAMAIAIWPLRDTFILLPIALGVAVYVAAVLLLRLLDDWEWGLIRQLGERVFRRVPLPGRTGPKPHT